MDQGNLLTAFLESAACPVCGASLADESAGQASSGGRLLLRCPNDGWFEVIGRDTPGGREYALIPDELRGRAHK